MVSVDNFEFAHRHRDEVVWMSQNTNTIPLAPEITAAIQRAVEAREYNLYALKRGIFGLPEAIRNDLRTPDLDMAVTNGGIEGEYMATRALLAEGDEVLSTDPSFLPVHEQVAMSRASPVEVDIYREPHRLTAEWANEAVTARTRMLLLIDPNNPLGSGYPRSEVRALAEVARDHDLWLLDDITYRDFNPEHTLASEFYPEKTIVAYSFSKGCGLAGMRVGALLAPPDVLRRIRTFDTNVLGVNVLAQRAALAALETKPTWIDRLRKIVAANQEIVKAAVAKVDGCSLPVYPSKANMFVIDTSATGVDPEAIERKMLHDHLVHARAGSYLSKRFGSRFLRVSFSIPTEQCERFGAAFPQVVAGLSAQATRPASAPAARET